MRYVLRRDRVLRQLKNILPCPLLEVGCGSGALLQELAVRGYQCSGLETSAAAIALAARICAATNVPLEIVSKPNPQWAGKFQVLVALEVLEHIEDDAAALLAWRSFLVPGATLILSVPAHHSRWGAGDEWAGHFRRYEKEQLRTLITNCGYSVEQCECYGFPAANILEYLAENHYRKSILRDAGGNIDRVANNDRSGTERSASHKLFRFMQSLPGSVFIKSACLIQQAFIGTSLGTGYLARARVS